MSAPQPSPPLSTDPAKMHAARTAASLVRSGMLVGLGSGSTAALTIGFLAERRQAEKLELVGVATSEASANLARSLGIPLVDLDDCGSIDLTIDGADEVDANLAMIKGRGGALLREKLVAVASLRRIYVVGRSKRVGRLGESAPLPVEVAAFGIKHTERRLQTLGAETQVRKTLDGRLFVTDGGNALIDCRFGAIVDPEGLNVRLKSIVGVFETGLFLNLCDTLIVGDDTGAEVMETWI